VRAHDCLIGSEGGRYAHEPVLPGVHIHIALRQQGQSSARGQSPVRSIRAPAPRRFCFPYDAQLCSARSTLGAGRSASARANKLASHRPWAYFIACTEATYVMRGCCSCYGTNLAVATHSSLDQRPESPPVNVTIGIS